MAELSGKQRKALPRDSFALPKGGPDGEPAYPIDTKSRAVSALARVEANGTPAEKSQVRAAVAREYPDLPSSQGKGTSRAAASARRTARRAGKSGSG